VLNCLAEKGKVLFDKIINVAIQFHIESRVFYRDFGYWYAWVGKRDSKQKV